MAACFPGRMSLLFLLMLPATEAAAQTTLESRGEIEIFANPPQGIFQSTGGVVATTTIDGTYNVIGITRQPSGIGRTTTWVEIAPAGDPDAAPLGWVPFSSEGGNLVMTDPTPRTRSIAPPGKTTSSITTRTILEMAQ